MNLNGFSTIHFCEHYCTLSYYEVYTFPGLLYHHKIHFSVNNFYLILHLSIFYTRLFLHLSAINENFPDFVTYRFRLNMPFLYVFQQRWYSHIPNSCRLCFCAFPASSGQKFCSFPSRSNRPRKMDPCELL